MLRRQANRKATARNSAGASDISNDTLRPRRILCAIHDVLLLCRMRTCIFGAWLFTLRRSSRTAVLVNSATNKFTLLLTCKSKFEGGVLNSQQRDLG